VAINSSSSGTTGQTGSDDVVFNGGAIGYAAPAATFAGLVSSSTTTAAPAPPVAASSPPPAAPYSSPTIVWYGDTLVLSSGQSLGDVIVYSGATLKVLGGASVGHVSMNYYGHFLVASGYVLTGTVGDGGAVDGGVVDVGAGGNALGLVVAGRGRVEVLSGGYASGVVVDGGGDFQVLSGAVVSDTVDKNSPPQLIVPVPPQLIVPVYVAPPPPGPPPAPVPIFLPPLPPPAIIPPEPPPAAPLPASVPPPWDPFADPSTPSNPDPAPVTSSPDPAPVTSAPDPAPVTSSPYPVPVLILDGPPLSPPPPTAPHLIDPPPYLGPLILISSSPDVVLSGPPPINDYPDGGVLQLVSSGLPPILWSSGPDTFGPPQIIVGSSFLSGSSDPAPVSGTVISGPLSAWDPGGGDPGPALSGFLLVTGVVTCSDPIVSAASAPVTTNLALIAQAAASEFVSAAGVGGQTVIGDTTVSGAATLTQPGSDKPH
jgi:hypothetical protein